MDEETGKAPLRTGRVVMSGAHTWVPREVMRGGVTCLASADEDWNIAVRHGRVIEWDQKCLVHWFPEARQGKVVAVTAGGPQFAAALSSTGEVIVWGRSRVPEMLERDMPPEVHEGKASAIAAGPDHLVAVVAGTVYWWGDWDSGRAHEVFRATGDEAAVEVATGQDCALVRTSRNRLVSWRMDSGDTWLEPPEEVHGAKVSAVSVFQRLAMALTEGGHAYSWGSGISTPRDEPLRISEPEVSAIAAGHYAFLGKADAPLVLAGDRPGGDPSDVNAVFPGDSVVTGKPYVLKKVSLGTPVLRLTAGGSSPTVLALAPATDAEVTLQEAYAFPVEVRAGSDLGFQWRVDNDGPARATGVQVTLHLPPEVTLHPKHREAVHRGTITDLGGGGYRFTTEDLEPQEGGWTFPLMTKVAAGAAGRLTATADVTAHNISDPAPALSVSSDVTTDGDRWDSSDDSDLWKLIGGALAGGLAALFGFFSLPGGGSSSRPSSDNKPKRKRKKDKKNKFTTIRLDASANLSEPAAGAEVVMTWTLKNTGEKHEAESPSVTVKVPTGLTITDAKPARGTAKVLGPRSALFRPGSLGKGKDVTVEITAEVADDPPTSVKALGVAVADNAAPAGHTLTVTPRRKAALHLPEGEATPSKLQPGKDVSFAWSLTNDGPSSARNTKLTVTVPKGLSDVAVTADGKPLATTEKNKNQLVAKLSDLKKDATVKLAVKGKASKNATSNLTTAVEITADDAGNGVRDSVTAALGTVLEVEGKIVGKVAASASATYLWTVRNTTGVEATDVRLSMTAPPPDQARFDTATPPAASTDDGISWELDTVQGKSVSYAIASFQVFPDQSRKQLGPTAATVKAANADEVSVKNKPRADIAEKPTLILLPFDYSQGPVGLGQPVKFVWTLRNEGSDATDVTVTVTPPGELSGATVSLEGEVEGTVTGNTVTFAWLVGGADCVIGLTGTLNAPRPGPYSAHAEVARQGRAVSSAACTRTAISEASLTVTAAAHNPPTLEAGSSAVLRWTVSRAGEGPLQSTYLAIDLPDKVWATAVITDHHVVPRRRGRQVAPIDPALTKPVTVTMSVWAEDDLAAGPASFTATPVWKGAPQKVPTAPVTLTVVRRASVAPRSQLSRPNPVIAGEDAQLVWDVGNGGPSSCPDLTLTVPAIPGCSLLSATVGTLPAACRTTRDKPENWVIEAGTLHSGRHTQVAAKLAVAADAPVGKHPVTVALKGKTTDSSNPQDPVTVKRAAQVTATPTAAPPSCTAGDPVPYIWTLENDGPSVASVVFTVTLCGEKTKVTIPPATTGGATVTATPAATELTWKLTAPLEPRQSQVFEFIAQTDTTAGVIIATTQLTVNDEPGTQSDAYYTKVTPPPTHQTPASKSASML